MSSIKLQIKTLLGFAHLSNHLLVTILTWLGQPSPVLRVEGVALVCGTAFDVDEGVCLEEATVCQGHAFLVITIGSYGKLGSSTGILLWWTRFRSQLTCS